MPQKLFLLFRWQLLEFGLVVLLVDRVVEVVVKYEFSSYDCIVSLSYELSLAWVYQQESFLIITELVLEFKLVNQRIEL